MSGHAMQWQTQMETDDEEEVDLSASCMTAHTIFPFRFPSCAIDFPMNQMCQKYAVQNNVEMTHVGVASPFTAGNDTCTIRIVYSYLHVGTCFTTTSSIATSLRSTCK